MFITEHFLGRKLFVKLFGRREKKLLHSIDKYVGSHQTDQTFKIIEYQKGEWSKNKFHPDFPVVFRGAASDWNCTKKWSLDFFAEQYGDVEVTLFNNEGLRAYNCSQDFDTILLKDYIDQLRQGSKKYLKFSTLVQNKPELQNDINTKWLGKFHQKGSFSKIFYMFMGAKGTITPIHNGVQPTVFVQITGQKKWLFYSTGDRLFLGVRPTRTNYFYSDANPYKSVDDQFPLLEHAKRHEVILEPGDVMCFPALVWHQVENMTDSIGAAYKFVHLPSAYRSSKMMTLLFFLATKPFLLHSFFSGRYSKKDPVFTKKK